MPAAPLSGIDITLTLHGPCPAKKNLWKQGRGGRKYLDDATKAEIDALTWQAKKLWGARPPVEHPELHVRFFVSARRKDQDGMYTTILDCLQEAGVLVNDNIKRNNGRKVLHPCQIVGAGKERVEVEVRA